MSLRYDRRALRPPALSEAAVPVALLAWCRAVEGDFAWQATEAGEAELDALMRELDGDRALQALPGVAARWQLRLALRLRETLGLRRASDPWDCGHAADADALLHFLPRRPTLIVSPLPSAAAVLAARVPLFAHPVRLLMRRAPPSAGSC